jgi:hypothetical protein
LSRDNNEVQARTGSSASPLYLNYYGGRIDLLGLSNTPGDLPIDGSGFYFDNRSSNVDIGTTLPAEKLDVCGNRLRLTRVGSAAKHLDMRTDGSGNDIASYEAN